MPKLSCAFVFFLGYAFLLFQEETSVQALIEACMEEDGKLYLCVSSPTIKDKPVSSTACTKDYTVLSLKVFILMFIELVLPLTLGANSTLEPE